MVIKATLNSDMGEGFANYTFGNDDKLLKIIHLANVACGFHGGDPDIIDYTIKTAKQNNVHVGAHPSLPDKQGFGRREMKMEPAEFENCMMYQVGAISGFLAKHKIPLNHIKLHGSSYGMAARDLELAKAVARVATVYNVPIVGLAGTNHETACKELGVPFIPEWFADLNYSKEGKLLIARKHNPPPLDEIAQRTRRLLESKQVTAEDGTLLPFNAEQVTICVHSDNPTCVEIAETVAKVIKEVCK